MSKFEYRVIPAPEKGLKARGIKGTRDRFANALQTIMNDQAQDGWQYLRTDTLPCDERQGLTRRSTVYQNMLVFCRQQETEKRTRTQIAIDQQRETVMAEPTEHWRKVETDAAVDTNAEMPEVDVETVEPSRLGGVTRSESAGDR